MSEAYFTEIEAHFAMRRNTPFILSPKDWQLMKKWRDDGVPLPIVIEAIDTVFEKAAERKKTVNSLSYCRHAVKDLWAERQELYVGDGSATPEADPSPMLDSLAEMIPDPDIATRVLELARERSVPKIEERLMELERELIDRLIASLSADDLASVQAEIARVIGDASKLDPKTRARTEEANLRRIIRDRFALPRMTLFR